MAEPALRPSVPREGCLNKLVVVIGQIGASSLDRLGCFDVGAHHRPVGEQ